jgi:fumarate reductase flavoprotein subunit
MGGLVAAARARELGASVDVFEKGDRPGGSMLLSSGWVWRFRDFERFRAECPAGEPELQRLVWERMDEAIEWLRSLGAETGSGDTGNPLTTGFRFDTRELTGALVAAGGEVRLGSAPSSLPDGGPAILATGGFHAGTELLLEQVTPEAEHLLLRGNPWSSGDGFRLGLEAGGTPAPGLGEIYGRAMPALGRRLREDEFVPLSQLYARFAAIENENGELYQGEVHWSEIDVVQWLARQPGARGRFVVSDSALPERVRGRTVAEMIEAARAAGARVERRGGKTIVPIRVGITQTLGGLDGGGSTRVADGVWACGADLGGISTGGYSSGLAAALVTGLAAAEDVLR